MLALEESEEMTGHVLLHQHWTYRNIDRWAEPWEMLYMSEGSHTNDAMFDIESCARLAHFRRAE